MASIPPIIDIRDDLRRARDAADADVTEDFETVRDRLDAFGERDRADREGVVDEIDNQLLRVEELLDDEEATRAVRSARNRLHIYRESLSSSDEGLLVVDSGVYQHEEPEAERGEVRRPLPVGEVTLTVTVANSGEDAEVEPIVRFYDEDGEELESASGPAFDLAAGTEGRMELEVDVPSDATRYAVSVVRAA
ncbi:FxLYD domain-containing protein [Halorussus gelatinilyticus]|uniref:FxLYD domain-containing protein n=1 Tax=Halorussus gelatinilyticus TaxID=2937524 RepID=A0A8U0IKN7_9EURY|nr:FxLYD domain-containing protein [Halorussus gelatinilyticus]UPW01191.1 FxLYD domain-containing protein [Halorussus gelatinilyticus]